MGNPMATIAQTAVQLNEKLRGYGYFLPRRWRLVLSQPAGVFIVTYTMIFMISIFVVARPLNALSLNHSSEPLCLSAWFGWSGDTMRLLQRPSVLPSWLMNYAEAKGLEIPAPQNLRVSP